MSLCFCKYATLTSGHEPGCIHYEERRAMNLDHVKTVEFKTFNGHIEPVIVFQDDFDYDYSRKHLKYKSVKTADTCLWYAEDHKTGLVSFYAHSGKDIDERGFGGSIYNLNMEDGSVKVLRGPWSSRAGAMNYHGLGPCVDVTTRGGPGNYLLANHVTLEFWLACMRKFGSQYYIFKRLIGEPVWVLSAHPEVCTADPNGKPTWYSKEYMPWSEEV